ncbi:MAG: hypothetical protein OXQ31_15720 [Spirochaetaceae bacterium]|nr:hypothetical protein [Spirochaetaceae bacterium]
MGSVEHDVQLTGTWKNEDEDSALRSNGPAPRTAAAEGGAAAWYRFFRGHTEDRIIGT